jgi:tight adherence protein C
MNLLLYIVIAVTLFSGLTLVFTTVFASGDRLLKHRLREVTRSGIAAAPQRRKQKIEGVLFSFIRGLRARVGLSESPKLRERLANAGYKDAQAVELYQAGQMILPLIGIILGSFINSSPLFWILMMVIIGYMAPDFILDRKIKKRREAIRKSIPDAIDLLVICVDAGLGLDQAMLRVGQELAVSHPEINEEFLQINREQRAGTPRLDAWRNLAQRTSLPDIDGFVAMLVQTERFGTPIARALSSFADGMRQKRRQLAEERAAKTTVKIIFPLVLFVFPCMFIILLGPAILGMMKTVSHLMN